jgi:hypothetical protein
LIGSPSVSLDLVARRGSDGIMKKRQKVANVRTRKRTIAQITRPTRNWST